MKVSDWTTKRKGKCVLGRGKRGIKGGCVSYILLVSRNPSMKSFSIHTQEFTL